MNRFLSFSFLLILSACTSLMAQAPQGISYQAAARNSNGDPLTNRTVAVRFSLLDSLTNGPLVYQERHTVTTNAFGLFNLNIGTGTPLQGVFSSINWAPNAKFLRVELDTTSLGTSYMLLGTQQLMSVPYALYAASAGTVAPSAQAVVTTGSTDSIRYTSARAAGNVVSTGGKPVLARGVCVGTTPNPTDAQAVLASGTTTGSYQVQLNNLQPATTYHLRAFASTTAGTSYGANVTFTTLALGPPSLNTLAMSNNSSNSALASGSRTDDGGSAILEQGFCWGTAPNPTVSGTYQSVSAAQVNFSYSITGLITNTTYYVRAYALNAQGIAYGNQVVFTTVALPIPTVQTGAVSAVAYTTATVGGEVLTNGGTPILQRGIVVDTATNPTTANTLIAAGSGLGAYTAQLSGLFPNKTYYARAYAISAAGTAYGSSVSFTTLALSVPSLSTLAASGIGNSSANSGGSITLDGGSPISARGVCWSTSPNPSLLNDFSQNGSGSGVFSSSITGLTLNTTYYVRAYATNSLGTAYGNEISFSTTSQPPGPAGTPTLGTRAISKTDSSYLSGGYISSDGGSPVTQRGICWSETNTNPSLSDNVIYDDSTGIGFFSSEFTLPLTCGVTYYVRAFAINSAGVGYGNSSTVQSGLVPSFGPTSITVGSNASGNTAQVQLTILGDGGCSIVERGVVWSKDPNPLIFEYVTFSPYQRSSGSGTGAYTIVLDKLISNSTYYLRSYARNSAGAVFYGSETSFTTGNPPGLSIGQNYAGGIIFYLDSSGQHGLVCAEQDYVTRPWGCTGTSVLAGASFAIGSGAANTAAIVAGCPDTNSAAWFCDNLVLNGYSDWFLPSGNEMREIAANLLENGLGSSQTIILGLWWTSNEGGTDYGVGFYFDTSVNPSFYQFVGDYKMSYNTIRPCRAF